MTKNFLLPASSHSEVKVFFTFTLCFKQNPITHLRVFQMIWPHYQFLILKFEFYWCLRNIRSPSKWTGSHLSWPPLIMVVSKLMTKWGVLFPWPILSWPVTFGGKLTYLRRLHKRYESWRACIFEVLPILCITSWLILLS